MEDWEREIVEDGVILEVNAVVDHGQIWCRKGLHHAGSHSETVVDYIEGGQVQAGDICDGEIACLLEIWKGNCRPCVVGNFTSASHNVEFD